MLDPLSPCPNQKKNTVDPETMVNLYGADAVRWFILSDSPPEKDVQWSDTGVVSANKFLQRIWNLNFSIKERKIKTPNKSIEKKFLNEINNYIFKIDNSINEFRFNVSIAHFYEVYNVLKDYIDKEIDNKLFTENIIKIMKLMVPFVPHLAYECLELHDCKTMDQWPKIDKKNINNEIKIAIQVNGKTRDVLIVEKNLLEGQINQMVNKVSKAKKFLENKKVKKTIFVKDRIINYIIEN